MLFLEAGKVIIKTYTYDEGCEMGLLQFYDFGEDALLVFTAALLWALNERSVQVANPMFLMHYARSLWEQHTPKRRYFPLNLFVPSRRLFWETKEQKAARKYWEEQARKATEEEPPKSQE
jgi:hypothetical protein